MQRLNKEDQANPLMNSGNGAAECVVGRGYSMDWILFW